MSGVVQSGTEGREVARRAEPGQSVTFHPNCRLRKVKVGGVRELYDVRAMEI